MKLTWKLSVAVGLGVLVLLSAHAALRVRRDGERLLEDLRSDHRTLAKALEASVDLLAAREGEARARALVDEVNRRESSIAVRWIDPGQHLRAPGSDADRAAFWRGPGRMRSFTTTLDRGDEALVTQVSVRVPGRAVSAIEMIEKLPDEPWYEREAVTRTAITTAIVIILCMVTILGFGVVFVGRPLDSLRDHARRVGRGERAIRTEVSSHDEIGELAGEMNAMTAALDEAREKARSEEQARVVALAQLRHADRLRVVGEIASSIAHDLGTPLSAVRARSQMIAEDEVGLGRAKELAVANMDDVDRMAKRIRQLLDYARREHPREEAVGLAAWVAGTIDLVRPVSDRRSVRLSVRASEEVARFDSEQMRHVLMNLLTNAIEASPAGSNVRVEIDASAGRLKMTVSDDGPGISAELAERVFEPFFTTKPPGEGTGLGLSIARGIVEELGGRMTLDDRPRGTSFVVSIPLGEDPGTERA